MSTSVAREAGSNERNADPTLGKKQPKASKNVLGWIKSKIPGSYARSKGVRVWYDWSLKSPEELHEIFDGEGSERPMQEEKE